MIGDRELRLVLLALREGAIDPSRLAVAAAAWPTRPPTPLAQFLVNQGVLSAEQRERLERAAAELTPSVSAPAHPDGGITSDGGPNRDAEATTHPAPETNGSPGDPPAVGTRYQFDSLYRAGGLGRVWLARDTAVGRNVALKDLRPDRSADPVLRRRFVEEARITGQLEHPCIVPLYDLLEGPDGPCYTMRFVAGRTLAEAARVFHDARIAGRTDRLALTALLDAFVAVCRAVAYAHNRGVLHRDLKGQNIVLGEYGEVFVLDWGLAKLAGDQMTVDGPAVITPGPAGARDETVTGAVLGTPAFMAPETAGGQSASRASDVYGLGGLLYVILTGRPPYDGTTLQAVLDQLLEGPPPAPKAVNPFCPPALEAICRTAMARACADRYASAEAVAADIRRWLADEPVSVHPERWPARLMRWGRRHRAAVFGATAVLLTAMIALAVSTTLVWQAERRTAEQKGHAEQEWARAEENLGLAHGLAFNLLGISEDGLKNVPRSEIARKKMIDAALDTFRQALAQKPDDPDLREKTVRAYRFSANFHRMLDHNAAAEKSYRESIRLLEELVAEKPGEATFRDRLAEALRDQAQVFAKLGRIGDAVAAGRRAAGLAEELLAADPTAANYRRTLATGLIDLSGYEYIRGQFTASEKSAHQAVDLFRALVDTPTGTPGPFDRLLLAMALHRRAIALGELDRAKLSLEASADALVQLKKLSPNNNNVQHFTGRVLVEQAKILMNVPDRLAEAEKTLQQANRQWDVLQDLYPQLVMYREWQAAGYEVLGRVHIALHQTDAAADDLQKSLALLEKLVTESQDVPAYRSLLGSTCLTLGRLEAVRGNSPASREWLAKARIAFQAALDLSPESGLDHRGLGEVEAEWKRAARADADESPSSRVGVVGVSD